MPPRQQARRATQTSSSQGEHVFNLGKTGRKTGVTLPDKGVRDEHGMEPLDGIFSSPDKSPKAKAATANETDEEVDMDIDESGAQIGPATIAKLRKSFEPPRTSLPRARSPVKTSLRSPAVRHPGLQQSSSPARGSDTSVRRLARPGQAAAAYAARRKLDFSNPKTKLSHPQINGASNSQGPSLTNGNANHRGLSDAGSSRELEEEDEDKDEEAVVEEDEEGEEEEDEEDEDEDEDEDDAMDVVDAGNGDEFEPQEDTDAAESVPEKDDVAPAKDTKLPKRRGRALTPKEAEPSQADAAEEEVPARDTPSSDAVVAAKPKRGRTAKGAAVEKPVEATKSKRPRPEQTSRKENIEPVEDAAEDVAEDAAEERSSKRQRHDKVRAEEEARPREQPVSKTKSKPSAKSRPRRSSGVGVASPVVQRGPPPPKGPGLLISRHNLNEDGVQRTRSGRVSVKPLARWKMEDYEYDDAEEDDAVVDDKGFRPVKLVGGKLKGVVRVEEPAWADMAQSRRGRAASKKKGRRMATMEEEDEEEREEWEENPGNIIGEAIYWTPDQETKPLAPEDEVDVTEVELAIAEGALPIRDIKDATFKFAKTLTLPFFGSGVVDLPPHTEKRAKNSRKMQMVFFLHYGHVKVTIAQAEFGIGKGGMFFVPRGNHYSIVNNTDRPARMFFAQGCETFAPPPESQEL